MLKYDVEVSTIDSSFSATGGGEPKIVSYDFVVEALDGKQAEKKALEEHRKIDHSGRSIDYVDVSCEDGKPTNQEDSKWNQGIR